MDNFTPQQKRKLIKLVELGNNGLPSLLEYLYEIEENTENGFLSVDERFNNLKEYVYELSDEDKQSILESVRRNINDTKIARDVLSLITIDYDDVAERASKLITVPKALPAEKVDYNKIKTEVLNDIVIPTPEKGQDADEVVITSNVVATLEKKLPIFGEQFRDGLELLQGENRLDKSAIKGIDDYEDLVEFAKSGKGSTQFTAITGIKEIIEGDHIVVDRTNYQYPVISTTGLVENTDKNYLLSLSSGVIEGGQLSIGSPTSTFSISNGRGVIVDDYTNPLVPVVHEVTWSGLSNIVVTNIATETQTYILLDVNGAVFQTSDNPTDEQHRDYIFLGQIAHTNFTTVTTVTSSPDIMASPVNQLRDLEKAIGIINMGNAVTANGANLHINKTEGTLYVNGINFHTNNKIPSEKLFAAGTAVSFRYRTQTGAGSTTTSIDPQNYDLGGTITALIGTRAQNQRVYLTIGGNIVIQYGQQYYNSLNDALIGLPAETFVVYPNLETASLIGIISVERGTTDLTVTSKARFVAVSKFGEISGSSSSSSGGNIPPNVVNTSISIDATGNDYVRGDATAGDITITLITPVLGEIVNVKKVDATDNSVFVYSPLLIDGAETAELSTESESIQLIYTGVTYDII